MGKNIIRVTSNKEAGKREAARINKNLKSRGIKRIAYVAPVSRNYVKKLTRKGFTVRKKNYAIAIKNK